MDIEEKKLELEKIYEQLLKLKEALYIENKEAELNILERKTEENNFWEDMKTSQEIMREIKSLKRYIYQYKKIEENYDEIIVYLELYAEEKDEEISKVVEKNIKKINTEIERAQITTLLNEEYDQNNAIVTVHPGAGGTESQDWAEMLYRMYIKWATKNEYEFENLDFQSGDEAGIKSVTFLVKGNNAYGYLKCEKGVHRLVRISP
ncbi:MAG: PCRF domain-containing protein, partial [Clostridia bacterium]